MGGDAPDHRSADGKITGGGFPSEQQCRPALHGQNAPSRVSRSARISAERGVDSTGQNDDARGARDRRSVGNLGDDGDGCVRDGIRHEDGACEAVARAAWYCGFRCGETCAAGGWKLPARFDGV